ncbi:MAG: hypothetical protein RIT43_681 [Bacteroidota bacterium]
MKYSILIFTILFMACSRSRTASCNAYGDGNTETGDNHSAPASVSDTISQISEVRIATVASKKKTSQSIKFEDDLSANSEDKVSKDQQIKISLERLNALNESVSRQSSQRTPLVQSQAQIEQELALLEKLSPNSFEFYLNHYVAGKHNVNLISSLEKATKLEPQHPQVISQWAAYGIISDNETLASRYLNDWFSEQADSQFTIDYAMNMLNSVDENGALFVHGIEDTYSAFYVQLLRGIRRDVRVISLELLQSEAYRMKLNKEGWKLPLEKTIGPEFLKEFCDLNSAKDISLSLTIPREYFDIKSSSLYLVGVTLVHSSDPSYQNFYRNELIWNEKWNKDFLQQFTNETSIRRDKISNYLPVLLQFHSVYEQEGNTALQQEIDVWIKRIAQYSGKLEVIDKITPNKE